MIQLQEIAPKVTWGLGHSHDLLYIRFEFAAPTAQSHLACDDRTEFHFDHFAQFKLRQLIVGSLAQNLG